jgi:hypothetical protein
MSRDVEESPLLTVARPVNKDDGTENADPVTTRNAENTAMIKLALAALRRRGMMDVIMLMVDGGMNDREGG